MGEGRRFRSRTVREHVRSNVVGYVALFCFMTLGTAQALPGKNKVDSGDIKKGNVNAVDLAADAVTSRNVADGSLLGADVADNSLTGTDINESTLSLGPSAPSGPAGGSLSGEFPNPTIAAGAVSGGQIADDTGTDDDLAASAQFNGAAPTSGDLIGAYPNPTVGAGAISGGGGGEIVDGSLTGADLGNGAVVGGAGGDLQDNTLTSDDIANTTRVIDLPISSFVNCGASAAIDFTSGADTARDFVSATTTRLHLEWDTGDTDNVCASLGVPPDYVSDSGVVSLLNRGGSANNNDWAVGGNRQRVGGSPNGGLTTTGGTNCDAAVTDGFLYECILTIGASPTVQAGDALTLAIARAGGSDLMELYAVQFRYTARQ